jgi:lysyl-tRNA synthetase class I
MFQGLSPLARDAKAWPFEQARNLLARILRVRLTDGERDLAATLIGSGKAAEAVASLPALARPVILETGYGPSGLPHLGTFQEVVLIDAFNKKRVRRVYHEDEADGDLTDKVAEDWRGCNHERSAGGFRDR